MDAQRAQDLVDAMTELNEIRVLTVAFDCVTDGDSQFEIFEHLVEGIRRVDRRYENGEYFIADLIMAGHIMKSVMSKVLVFPKPEGFRSMGRVLMATVRGDIHELGKQMVSEVLQHNGFEVRDLGTDVFPEQVLSGIREFSPNILMLSGMLTASADSMTEITRAVDAAGLRCGLRIVAGGAATSGKNGQELGVDACAEDALDCLRICHEFMAMAAGER